MVLGQVAEASLGAVKLARAEGSRGVFVTSCLVTHTVSPNPQTTEIHGSLEPWELKSPETWFNLRLKEK